MLEKLFFWKNNNNNHKYNHPKNILKKKSYFFKINMKNSKIDRRTKILFVLHGENPKG